MRHAVLSLLLVAATPAGAAALDCVSTPGLAVDADGAPDSYRVDGKGLSFTCDGVFAVVNGVVHSRPACAENPIWEVPAQCSIPTGFVVQFSGDKWPSSGAADRLTGIR